ncbi:MAG: DUF4340 domain-containing protein [Patescibacteria group bacterium]
MFKHKNILLIIIIIALGLIAWGLYREGSLDEKTKQPQLRFSSNVDKIEIRQKDGAIILVKGKEDRWQVEKSGIAYPANQSALDEIIKFFDDFTVGEIISQNPDKYAELQVDEESGFLVKWFIKDKEEGKLILGKSDYNRQGDYIRIGDQTGVYLTSGNIKFNFSRPEFRDLNILSLKSEEIERVAWNYKDGEKLEIKKLKIEDAKESDKAEEANQSAESKAESNAKKWFLMDGDAKQELDESKVNSLLGQLSNLTATDMLVKSVDKDYGFSEPFFKLTVGGADDQEYILTFGAQADEAPAYYAQISGNDEWVYLVDISTVQDQLAKKAGDFETTKEE